jgi:hypothetical protein
MDMFFGETYVIICNYMEQICSGVLNNDVVKDNVISSQISDTLDFGEKDL